MHRLTRRRHLRFPLYGSVQDIPFSTISAIHSASWTEFLLFHKDLRVLRRRTIWAIASSPLIFFHTGSPMLRVKIKID